MNACRPSRRDRHGVSLFETMAVLGIATMMLVSLLVAVKSAYQVDRRVRDNLSAQLTLEQLVRQWRSDGHTALAAEKTGEQGVALNLADGRKIKYAPGEKSLLRTVTREGRTLAREELALPPNTACTFDLPAEKDGKLLCLKLASPGEPAREFLVALGAVPLAAAEPEVKP